MVRQGHYLATTPCIDEVQSGEHSCYSHGTEDRLYHVWGQSGMLIVSEKGPTTPGEKSAYCVPALCGRNR